MDSFKNKIAANGNLQVGKPLLSQGKDILINGEVPIKFIIRLVPEEVDALWICGLSVVLSSERVRWTEGRSGAREEDTEKGDTLISWEVL